MGTRRIPAMHGGFETMVWDLAPHLADLGYEVTMYCREGWTDESLAVPSGIRRRFLPSIPGKPGSTDGSA